MKNNPFISFILLIFIEIALYTYIDYIDLILPSSEYDDWVMPFFIFFIPVIDIFISIFGKDMRYKKTFRYFSVFLLITSVVVFIALSFLIALGRGYQH